MPLPRDPRTQRIINLAMTGRFAMAELAEDFGVSRQRVEQILIRDGLKDRWNEIRAEVLRKEREGTRRGRIEAAIAAVNEGVKPLNEITKKFKITEPELRAFCGNEAVDRLPRRTHWATNHAHTKEQVLEGIRLAWEKCDKPVLSNKSYDRIRRRDEDVAAVRVLQLFGTWKAACKEAGVPCGDGRDNYKRRWTPEQLLDVLAKFLRECDETGLSPSYRNFDLWCQEHPEYPSAQTVRNQTTPRWVDMRRAARERMNDA